MKRNFFSTLLAAALFATLSTGTAVFAEETADVTTVPDVTEKPEETTTVISENAASGEVTAETSSSEQFSPDDVLKFFNMLAGTGESKYSGFCKYLLLVHHRICSVFSYKFIYFQFKFILLVHTNPYLFSSTCFI